MKTALKTRFMSGRNKTGDGSPIFALYFEDSKFSAGHYQAVRPVVNGPVVRDLHDLYKRTGQDIAQELGLPDQSILPEYYNQRRLKSQIGISVYYSQSPSSYCIGSNYFTTVDFNLILFSLNIFLFFRPIG